jgi:hypothetical protein
MNFALQRFAEKFSQFPSESLPRMLGWHPTAMQAIQILTTGSADVLTLRDLPTPAPAPGEALIRIEA